VSCNPALIYPNPPKMAELGDDKQWILIGPVMGMQFIELLSHGDARGLSLHSLEMSRPLPVRQGVCEKVMRLRSE